MYSSYVDVGLATEIVKLQQELNSFKTSQRYGLVQYKSQVVNPLTISTYKVNNFQTGVAAVIKFVGDLYEKTAMFTVNYGGYNTTGTIYTMNYLTSNSPNEVRMAIQIDCTASQVSIGGYANMGGYLELEGTYTFPDA